MVYLSPRKIPGFPAMADWDVCHLTIAAGFTAHPAPSWWRETLQCLAPHPSPDCQVPKMCQDSFKAGGKQNTPTTIKGAPASQPLTASSFTFAFISFTFCTAGLLPGQTAESAASAAAQLQLTHIKGAVWGQERPLGQQQPTMRFDVKLHLYPAASQLSSADTPREGESPVLVNTVQGGVTGEWQAQLELLLKLESKWRPGTFQRVKYCCCPLMTDRTTKPKKSRDCHWKYLYWRTVIGSL